MKVCDAMQSMGHDVHLWVPGDEQTPFEQLSEGYGLAEKFRITWLPSASFLKRYDFTVSSLRAVNVWQPDLIYTWLPQVAWGGSAFLKIPVVLEMHDRASGKFGLFWLKRFMKSVPLKELVVVSKALQKALELQAGFSFFGNEVVVAPNGVDMRRYKDLPESSYARKILGLKDKLTIGYTGHFYAGRGIETLVQIALAYPDYQQLWVGGRESDVINLKNTLKDKNVSNVMMPGFIENSKLPLYQAACDILLMPYENTIAGSSGGNSVDICSPMKMFEYMAVGRAIISSDLPVIHEVLDNETAFFCPPEDPSVWVNSVGLLASNADKRASLGYNAKNRIENYSIIKRQENILKFVQ
jgi:glycosyltransferase involved in cell wall biosynthesis